MNHKTLIVMIFMMTIYVNAGSIGSVTHPILFQKEAMASPSQNKEQPNKRVVGFDCEFLEPPPEHLLQSECPVCLQIIREPHQVTCCGNSFCYSCIQRVKDDNKPCPTCNKEGLSDFPDKRLKRSLYALKVRCSHQKDGCEWTGELGQLDEHLNTAPLPEKRLHGCPFVEINCVYNCEDKLQRRHIQNHQTDRCRKRPFGCEHCHDYKSTYDDAINNHWPVCGSFPIPCPNQCGSTIQRQNIDSHVADECPLTTINCDFHHVGCAVKLPRQDMPEHQRENLLTHISLLATSHAKQQAQINTQYEEIRALRMQMVSQPVLAMTNFQQHKTNGVTWYSPPVYTHHQGYKICLGVDASNTIISRQTRIHIRVFFMKGEFDDSLTWPFQGQISIQLLDQVKGEKHFKLEIRPTRECSRVTEGEKATDGYGMSYLISTEGELKCLQNDTLLFQICSVRLQ